MKRALTLAGIALLTAPLLTGCGDDSDAADKPAESSLTAAQKDQIKQAGNEYAAWVVAETDRLLAGTAKFVAAYKAGQDDLARRLYAPTRAHWEAIEPVAETFGDLDPKTDAREADLEEGDTWGGWHLIEKDLWPQDADTDYVPLTAAERAKYADDLAANLSELDELVAQQTYTGAQIANGAKELLDEVATGKITGEEETWSHTDLYDFQANVNGAKKAYDVLKPVVDQTDPDLSKQLATRFSELRHLLDQHRKGAGVVSYTDLTEDQIKELSDSVNALSEPLAQLASAVA